MIKGNVASSGDIQIEGTIEGDVRAHLLTVGESATVRGEVIADDVVVDGRVTGRVRGLKVRLTSSAKVEGDVVHKTIAIESGAHFEGSVQRKEDPLDLAGFKERYPAPDEIKASVFLSTTNDKDIDNLAQATKEFIRYIGYELEAEHEYAV